MVQMFANYKGEKHCEVIHGPSKSKIGTDAPKDNNGKGELFSPTDLLGAALGTCMLTTMAIMGEKEGLQIKGSHCTVEKEMIANPRRIGKLIVQLHLPSATEIADRSKLESWAKNCPVTKSLHPELEIPIQFFYDV